MTERATFECNLTGETFEDSIDVVTVPIREHGNHPFTVRSWEIHLSKDALEDRLPRLAVPSSFGDRGFVGVKWTDDGVEVVGYCRPHSNGQSTGYPYEERGSVVGSHYEPFFELLESGEVNLL